MAIHSALGFGAARRTPSPSEPPAAPTRDPAEPPRFEPAERLRQPATYDEVFRVVRAAVRHVLRRERPGLGLGLSNLPPGLGAYWPVTGNLIVMNEGLVEAMRAMAGSTLEFNSFVYVILAHEYLHALGYFDEAEVRRVVAFVTRRAFGSEHPATRMAEGDLWQMYPFLRYAPQGDGRRLRMVPDFDSATTQSYIR
jgi:hypothetical protein